MTKLVKFMAAKAALPGKIALQANAGAKLDGNGFQALLRKLTSPTAAAKAEANAPSPRSVRSSGEMGERGDFEIGSSLRPVPREGREVERVLSDRPLAARLLTKGDEASLGSFPEEAPPDDGESEVVRANAPAIPSALSAFLFPPEKAPGARIEPDRGDAMPGTAAAPAAISRGAREVPEDHPAMPPAGPDFGIDTVAMPAWPARQASVEAVVAVRQIVTVAPSVVAQPVAATARQPSVEAGDIRPEIAPVIATVLSRETHFVPVRGRDAPVAIRGLHGVDRTEGSEPRPALAAPEVAKPGVTVDPDADDAPRQDSARGGEPVRDVAVAAAGPDPLPIGPPASGLPPAVLQQIGTAVVTGADSLAGRAPGRPLAPSETATPVPTPGRVDAMEVRLDLPEHGALHVRMTLAGTALSLRFRADREETAHRMQHDRDELSAILTRAGYSADILTIQVRPADGSALSQSMSSGGQPAAGGDGAAAQGQREHRQSQSQQPPPGSSRQNPDEHAPRRDRPSGGLYV